MNRSVQLPTLLDIHREALSDCRGCGHGEPVRPVLSLARTPRVMLVGQAPGQTEISGQRPFAGRAGRTLFRWLARAGITEEVAREHIYIAAVTRCYPGPAAGGRGDRVPGPEERARCRRWLDAELRMICPALLILVGRLAIDQFLPHAPLDELVGRSVAVDHVGGRSLAIPLPHPSGASSWIHEGDHARLLDAGLALIRRELVDRDIIPSCPPAGPAWSVA
ncbi:MAG: uracil-DNA glycosylase family protein [Gemmatimonadaceae bacterium]